MVCFFSVATNFNLFFIVFLSALERVKFIGFHINAMFHWALLFTLTHGSTPSAHYIIYMSWCLDFGLFYETHLKEQ